MMEEFILYGTAIAVTAVLILALKKVPRTKGKRVEFHVAYFVACALILFFVPEFIQTIFFGRAGVLIVGTLVPIYESIKAVVSIDEADDVAWLQFWLASGMYVVRVCVRCTLPFGRLLRPCSVQNPTIESFPIPYCHTGTFTYCTEWMDVVSENYPSIAEHWYEFEFLTLLWLLLPFTDGSTLLFDTITGPLLGEVAKKIKDKVDSRMALVAIFINSSYLWIVWLTFMTLDEEARRFIVIAVGTVYPIAASTVACTTKAAKRDDSFWLTYWACFSILFLMMDYLENFIGKIRGFYSICLCATVYLFLPMVS